MGKPQTVTRLVVIETPASDGSSWLFKYYVKMVYEGALQVVVNWEEHTMGSGMFTVDDCGVTWTTLHSVWLHLVSMSSCAVLRWEREGGKSGISS